MTCCRRGSEYESEGSFDTDENCRRGPQYESESSFDADESFEEVNPCCANRCVGSGGGEMQVCCTRRGAKSGGGGMQVCCMRGGGAGGLPFDVGALEKIILKLSDRFQFRVLMTDQRVQRAALITSGLSMAGALLGRRYGKVGMAVGSAAGAAIAAGYIAIAMRDVWEQLRPLASVAYELAFDYLSGLGLKDYEAALRFLLSNDGYSTELASLLITTLSSVLPYPILSDLART